MDYLTKLRHSGYTIHSMLVTLFTSATVLYFLSPMGQHTLPSHASFEACLTG